MKRNLKLNILCSKMEELEENIRDGMELELGGGPSPEGAGISDVLSEEEIAAIPAELFTPAAFDEKEAERISYSNYSYWASTMKNFWRNKAAAILIIALAVVILFALIQPYLPGQRPATLINNDPVTGMHLRNLAPSAEYWFGTNEIGQDLWARIWAGTRTSLFIGVVVALSDLVVGMILGLVWGYVRKVDRLFTEFYNIISNIPQTLILILVSYILRPSLPTIIISMCMVGWIAMARFVRNQVLFIRDRDFNLASRCLGTPTRKIILKNLIPQLVSVVSLQTVLAIPGAMGDEVFLTYIGLGLPVSIPSLGNLVNDGRVLMMSPSLRYQLLFPAAVIGFITIAFYVIGNAFADASDPKNHV